ncbi:MAG: autotransporter assembly complex protein TamA [Alcanivorax sp.]
MTDRLKFWDSGLEKEYDVSGIDDRTDLKTYIETIVESGREDALAEDEEQEYRDETIRLNVLKALRSRGYYAAAVTFTNVSDTDADETKGVFDIRTGKQALISSVSVVPNSFQHYLDEISLKAGDPLSAEKVLAAQAKLYRIIEQESCAYNLTVTHRVGLDQQTYEADVIFEIEKGKDAQFGALTYSGADKVEREYIDKVITWNKGGCFKHSKIDSVKEKLLATGLFSRVEAVLPENAKASDVIPVELALRERAARTISAGMSYYTDEGVGVILGWEHRNLLGQGERFNADLTLSLLEQTLEGTLSKPYFMRNDQTLNMNSFVKREDTDAYESFGLGGGFGVKRVFNKNLTGSVGADVELTRIKEENKTTDNFALFSPNASITYDSRDDELDPHKGVLAKFSVVPTLDMFGESNPYVTNKLSAQSYYEVHKKLVLAGRINVGSIVGSNAESLPVSKLFFAGGGGSVRGFGYQEVGPFEDGDPQGGRSLIETSLELRYKATDTLGAVAFVDMGEVDNKILPSLEDPSIGAGLGFRYYTDFGPLRFDVGVPLSGDENTDENFQVYISIGQAF